MTTVLTPDVQSPDFTVDYLSKLTKTFEAIVNPFSSYSWRQIRWRKKVFKVINDYRQRGIQDWAIEYRNLNYIVNNWVII